MGHNQLFLGDDDHVEVGMSELAHRLGLKGVISGSSIYDQTTNPENQPPNANRRLVHA